MAIVGAKEAEAGKVSLRRHGKGDVGQMTVDELVALLHKEVAERV